MDNNFAVIHDEVVGRTLIARKSFLPGELLWTEQTFLYSDLNIEFENDGHLSLINAAFNKTTVSNISTIIDDLAELDKIECVDTAKNLLLLLSMYILKRKDSTMLIRILTTISNNSLNNDEINTKLDLIHQLTAANLDECIHTAKQIRSIHKTLIPKAITNEEVGRLLGILNTNQLELDIGGSGLFPYTAIVQHSCDNNTSFTTYGNTLYFVATKPIAVSDRITIDYGNNYYHSTPERVISLEETYGFQCICALCTGIDRKRGYKCRACTTGVVYPTAMGETELNNNNICQQCHTFMSPIHYKLCTAREQYYIGKKGMLHVYVKYIYA